MPPSLAVCSPRLPFPSPSELTPLPTAAVLRADLRCRERRRASAATLEQVARMIRQVQLDMTRLFLLLTVLVAQLGSMETLLNNMIQRLLVEQLASFQSSLMVFIQDTIRSTIQTEMQGRQAAPIPNVINDPPRQMSEGFPETGGITRVKLRFVDVDRPENPLFTGCPVKWQNGENPKVAIFENDTQIMQGDLSKLQIEILAVNADFFTKQGQEDFTKEQFNRQIYLCKGKDSVLTTVNLANGKAYIGSIFFTESSQRRRLRLTARVKKQDLAVRVQEAITDPFVVQVSRNKANKKSYPPSKEEAVHCLERIAADGKHCQYLAGKSITTVKHFMRHYHIDKSGLQKRMLLFHKFQARRTAGRRSHRGIRQEEEGQLIQAGTLPNPSVVAGGQGARTVQRRTVASDGSSGHHQWRQRQGVGTTGAASSAGAPISSRSTAPTPSPHLGHNHDTGTGSHVLLLHHHKMRMQDTSK